MTTSSSQHWRLRAGVLLAAALTASLAYAPPAAAAEGLRVSGTRVVESNGNNFIMRGVNHGHAWFTGRTAAFADIKSFRSNVIRVVLSGGRWGTSTPADVANVVSLCKANRMICVLEDHDTTGYGEDTAAYSLDQAVEYFATLKSVLDGQEDYVVINPGNEPIGNNDPTQWIAATTRAVTRLRSLGFQHLIMIDAPNWGQDWKYVMRDSAQTIWASDPNANLVFSIHMYGVFNTASSITSYLDVFRDAGLPLVIGEFGYRNNNSSNVDHDTVLAEAEARGLGYIGWSWCGNNDPYLDMVVNWDKNNLSPWGARILNGPNGIVATAREAAIFGGSGTTFDLTVARAGTGSGTVAGGGISCGATCSASFASGTSVTLTATPASGSAFAGWGGECLGTSPTCVVTMTAARSVTATFSPVTTSYPLTVAKSGTGAGVVTGPSVDCGTTCAAAYASGTTVTLTATAANGAVFGGWSGACTGTSATCILSMTAARTVTATFSPISTGYGLTVSKTGTGSGTVTSSTGGISCGTACSATYAGGTSVTLTATPASGSQFSGWSGACTGAGTTCTVSMTAARNVVATFAPTATTPCANPITFTGNTSNFNTTGAVCYRTAQTINGWGCYNMDGRTLTVNGTQVTCGRMPLPAKAADGYTYFSATAGTYPWAGIYAW